MCIFSKPFHCVRSKHPSAYVSVPCRLSRRMWSCIWNMFPVCTLSCNFHPFYSKIPVSIMLVVRPVHHVIQLAFCSIADTTSVKRHLVALYRHVSLWIIHSSTQIRSSHSIVPVLELPGITLTYRSSFIFTSVIIPLQFAYISGLIQHSITLFVRLPFQPSVLSGIVVIALISWSDME